MNKVRLECRDNNSEKLMRKLKQCSSKLHKDYISEAISGFVNPRQSRSADTRNLFFAIPLYLRHSFDASIPAKIRKADGTISTPPGEFCFESLRTFDPRCLNSCWDQWLIHFLKYLLDNS